MPVRRALAKVFNQHQTDAARDLDADGEGREQILSGYGSLLAEASAPGRMGALGWITVMCVSS